MRNADKEKAKINIFGNRFKYDPVPVRVKNEGKPWPFVQAAAILLGLAVIAALIHVWTK